MVRLRDVLSGHYILFDQRPDRDGARPVYDDDALPPPRPVCDDDALPPLPPLLPPTQPFPPPLSPLLLPPPPQLPPLQQLMPTQLPLPQQPAPPLPSQPLPLSQPQPTSLPLSQPQPTLSWHLVSESHSAEIDIPHDGACHQLGRRGTAHDATTEWEAEGYASPSLPSCRPTCHLVGQRADRRQG